MSPERAAELRAAIIEQRAWCNNTAPAISADELLALIDRAFPIVTTRSSESSCIAKAEG